MDITIRRGNTGDIMEWVRMRMLLWTEMSIEDARYGMDELLADPQQALFVAARADGCLAGFVEAGTRDYGEGCETSPVGYLEGWFVDEDLRGRGLGRLLFAAAEDWARGLGLTEMGSDTWLDNDVSIAAHGRLGYEEVERLVHFVKKL